MTRSFLMGEVCLHRHGGGFFAMLICHCKNSEEVIIHGCSLFLLIIQKIKANDIGIIKRYEVMACRW